MCISLTFLKSVAVDFKSIVPPIQKPKLIGTNLTIHEINHILKINSIDPINNYIQEYLQIILSLKKVKKLINYV